MLLLPAVVDEFVELLEPGFPCIRLHRSLMDLDPCYRTSAVALARRFVATDPLNHLQSRHQEQQGIGRSHARSLACFGLHSIGIDGRAFYPTQDGPLEQDVAGSKLTCIHSARHGGAARSIEP